MNPLGRHLRGESTLDWANADMTPLKKGSHQLQANSFKGLSEESQYISPKLSDPSTLSAANNQWASYLDYVPRDFELNDHYPSASPLRNGPYGSRDSTMAQGVADNPTSDETSGEATGEQIDSFRIDSNTKNFQFEQPDRTGRENSPGGFFGPLGGKSDSKNGFGLGTQRFPYNHISGANNAANRYAIKPNQW
jgi:hypothetical protein